MRIMLLCLLAATGAAAHGAAAPADAFAALSSLAGDWQADLPGYGVIADTVRLVSNGRAIEETIGTSADNEISVYSRDGARLLLTHFCAMTPDGHVVRLQAPMHPGADGALTFTFRDATNLPGIASPHMRRMVLTITDADHFRERWTRVEKGVDTVFDLNFVRRPR